ncbi:hypothetical protein TSMEX_008537 [Taenia solium]|eukprot:TsM_000875600 transcript=TsM_000875600 gene=TsM_000875600
MSRWWWRSVPRNEECDVSSASSIGGSSVWRESERDCDPGRTISEVPASNISLPSSTQYDYQEGSGRVPPDEPSEIFFTSLSECGPYEEPMHDKPSSKKTLLLPELIDAAVETTAPVSICDVVCTLSDPTITVRPFDIVGFIGDTETRSVSIPYQTFHRQRLGAFPKSNGDS